MRESAAVPKASKTKQNVSAAGVFKKKRSAGANNSRKQHKCRTATLESTPESDLADDFAGTNIFFFSSCGTC
jgi:hypothetical protein